MYLWIRLDINLSSSSLCFVDQREGWLPHTLVKALIRYQELSYDIVPLVGFTYFMFTHMPVRVTIGDLGLCCICVLSFKH